MRVLVFSDSHGAVEPMCLAVERHKPDLVLHLGDLARDAEDLARHFPGLDVRSVQGNCDGRNCDAPEFLQFNIDALPVYMTHGHRQRVKFGLHALANAVHFSGAKLGLFGHTHATEYKKMGDVTLFNPGSVGFGGTYGLITVKGTEFQCNLEKV